jgi:hypothetical protein
MLSLHDCIDQDLLKTTVVLSVRGRDQPRHNFIDDVCYPWICPHELLVDVHSFANYPTR